MGQEIISWTIRLSMLLFFGSLIGWLAPPSSKRIEWCLCLAWSAGVALFIGHVVAAYHFHHHWSHSAALADTARQTRDLIGIEFGGGLYFNYAFMLIWGGDVAWIWSVSRATVKRFRWLRIAWLAFLVFIAINGVAVFKGGWIRTGGITAISLMLLATILRWRSHCTRQRLVSAN